MRGVVERFVDEFLSAWQGRGSVDLLGDFGFLLPANVIATIIGAPREDLGRFRKWSHELTELLHGGVGTPSRMDVAQQAIIEFKAYLQGLYDERVKRPRDDMMSWLMEVQRRSVDAPGGRPLPCMLILNAAGDDADPDRQHGGGPARCA